MSEQEPEESPKSSTARPARKRAAAKPARRPSTSQSRSTKRTSKTSASRQSEPDHRDAAEGAPDHSADDEGGSARQSGGGSGSVPPLRLAAMAAQQLELLTGREHESVTGLERTEGGWVVNVEVLELRRVPATTDVLATYEVDIDDQGDLQGYRRTVRYVRGSAGGDRE